MQDEMSMSKIINFLSYLDNEHIFRKKIIEYKNSCHFPDKLNKTEKFSQEKLESPGANL